MKRLFVPSAHLASLLLIGPVHAEVIDSTVITDFVDQTPGFNEVRNLGVTISGDEAVYLVGTMNFDPMELGSSYVEANLGDTSTDRVYVAGFGNGFGGNTIVIAENGTEATAPQTFTEAVPTLLVVKFDQTTGDSTLWVDPDLATSEDLNPADATTNVALVNGSSFDSVVFRAGDFDADKSVVDLTGFAVYYNGDTPFGSVPQFTPRIVDFTYDSLTGDSEVSIEGEVSSPYVLVEADDLDFGNPDQNPVPLTGATVGTLDGDQVTTDGDGNATVQFNLGTAKPRTFIRAEDAPPPPPLLSEDFEGGAIPAGWLTSGTGTTWSVGTPNGDGGTNTEPSAAAGGTFCAGTNMNGKYANSADARLVTSAFTVPVGGATLELSYYIDTEASSGGPDFGTIRLLNAADGTPLTDGEVAPDLQGTSLAWNLGESLALPAVANGLEVKLEFGFVSDDAGENWAGFYIDDVVVTGN